MPSTPQAHHLTCSVCSQLRNREQALEHVQGDEEDSHLPEAVSKLEIVREIRPGHPGLRLMRCVECGTYYLFRSVYEFLIGFGGSYDSTSGLCAQYGSSAHDPYRPLALAQRDSNYFACVTIDRRPALALVLFDGNEQPPLYPLIVPGASFTRLLIASSRFTKSSCVWNASGEGNASRA